MGHASHTQAHWCTAALVHWCIGALVCIGHWCWHCACVHWCIDRCIGALGIGHLGIHLYMLHWCMRIGHWLHIVSSPHLPLVHCTAHWPLARPGRHRDTPPHVDVQHGARAAGLMPAWLATRHGTLPSYHPCHRPPNLLLHTARYLVITRTTAPLTCYSTRHVT